MNKGQKIDTANSDNVKHYKNLLSPTKKRMQKIVENKKDIRNNENKTLL